MIGKLGEVAVPMDLDSPASIGRSVASGPSGIAGDMGGWMEWFASSVAGAMYALTFAIYTVRFLCKMGMLNLQPENPFSLYCPIQRSGRMPFRDASLALTETTVAKATRI